MKIEMVSGIEWIEPNHVKVSDLVERIRAGESIDQVRSDLGITDENHWVSVAKAVFCHWKLGGGHPDGNDELVAEVNRNLAPYALSFPGYGTRPNAESVKRLLTGPQPDIGAATKIVFKTAMHPRIRALQLVGRFKKIPLFAEFAYFIDCATVAYYRGNVVAALLTIMPVIEGILIRWQGFPGTLTKKPDFEKTKKFIAKSIYRQPVPHMPVFLESYVKTADGILREHLYKKSTDGSAFEDFNRHLALHMLDQRKFYSHDNVMRAFLLLDLLSDIYLCEMHQTDPRWNIQENELAPHQEAYAQALMGQTIASSVEKILFTHNEHG